MMIEDFLSVWEVIDHLPNDSSGFSATLLRNRQTGAYTLSFRSTESKLWEDGGDNERDGSAGADGEIAFQGFAWAQLRSMERYFERLRRGELYTQGYGVSSQGEAVRQALQSRAMTVTGYSLGGHLAQLFTLMHDAQVTHAYTFNGAGFGWLEREPNVANYGTRLRAMLDEYERIVADPLPYLTDLNLVEIYRTMASIFPDLSVEEAKAALLASTGVTYERIYDSPLHKFATMILSRETDSAILSSLLEPNEILPFLQALGDGEDRTANPKVTNLFGLSLQWDPEFVSGAGQIVGSFDGVFIENQPIVTVNNPKTLFDVFGDTHSIVLIADSLAVMTLFEKLDPSVDIHALNGVFAAVSSSRAKKVALGADPAEEVAEGDSLERALDALGRIVVGSSWTATPFSRAAGAYGDIGLRNEFHARIAELRAAIEGKSAIVESLVGMAPAEIARRALSDAGYRHALRALDPFVVRGEMAAYQEAAAEIERFDEATAAGRMTAQYLHDRARLLALRIEQNLADVETYRRVSADGEYWQYQDGLSSTPMVAEVPLATADTPNHWVIFGDEADDAIDGRAGSDYLYGDSGDDVLDGKAGDDYLEGGVGDDTYVGLGERDVVVDVHGESDEYRIVGAGNVTILDADAQGRITWNGGALAGGVLQTPNAWRNGEFLDGALFRSTDRWTTYLVDRDDLVVTHQAFPGGTVRIRNARQSMTRGFLGMSFALPSVSLPATTYLDGDAGNTIRVSAERPGHGDPATTNASLVQMAGGDDLVFVDPVHVQPTEILLGAGRDRLVLEADQSPVLLPDLSATTVRAGEGDDILQPIYIVSDVDRPGDVPGTGARYYGEQGNDYFEGSGLDEFVDGGADHDTLLGEGGGDQLLGADGNDWIDANAGSDLVAGGAGNDWLFGGEGADLLTGGTGNDRIYADSDSNIKPLIGGQLGWDGSRIQLFDLHTMAGIPAQDYNIVDVAADRVGADEVHGGAGDDQIFGGGGGDFLAGDAGNDRLSGEAGDDRLDGGDGNDVLFGDKDPLQVASDMQTVWFNLAQTDINTGAVLGTTAIYMRRHQDDAGVAGNDRLRGGNGNDYLFGGGGDDRLDGGSGSDELHGGTGRDVLDGGEGDDFLFGGADDDIYRGDAGVDRFVDDAGDDTYYLSGDWGQDVIDDRDGRGILRLDVAMAGATMERVGRDLKIVAGANAVTIREWFNGRSFHGVFFRDGALTAAEISERLVARTGTAGDDLILGVAMIDDVVRAGDGDDDIRGLSGNDILDGGAGDDSIAGGDGHDVLISGGGNDRLTGGAGRDRYVLSAGQISITDEPEDGTVNAVALPGDVSSSDVQSRRIGNDLLLRYASGSVIIGDYYRAPDSWTITGGDGAAVDPMSSAPVEIADVAWVQTYWDAYRSRLLSGIVAGLQQREEVDGWTAPVHGALRYTVPDSRIRTSVSSTPGTASTYVPRDEYGNPLTDEQGNWYVFFWYDPTGGGSQPEQSYAYPQMWVVDGRLVDRTQMGGSGDDTLWAVAQTQNLPSELVNVWATVGQPYRIGSSNGYTSFHRDVIGLSSQIPAGREAQTTLVDGSDGYVATIRLYHLRDGLNVIHGGSGNDAINYLAQPYDATWADRSRGWRHDPVTGAWGRVFPSFDGDIGAPRDPLLADGGAGDDVLLGYLVDDVLRGGDGNDLINGAPGNDILAGEEGSDRLEGDGGADTYLIGRKGGGVDVVIDHASFAPDPYNPWYDDINRAAAFGDVMQFNVAFAAVTVHRIAYGSDREALLFTWEASGQRQAAASVVRADSATSGFGVETFRFIDAEYSREQLVALAITGGDPGVVIPLGLHDIDGNGVLAGTSVADDIDHLRWPAPYDPRSRAGLIVAAGNGNDTIRTGDQDDVIDGGAGADVMIGGAGNDRYVVEDARDQVTEIVDGGNDVIESGVSYSLAATPFVEDLRLTGTAPIDAAGNGAANRLTGNAAANTLDGDGGDDVLAGAAGDDTLRGGDGADTYVFDLGDGVDTVIDGFAEAHGSGLRFGAGIDASSFRFRREGRDLRIAYGDHGDEVRLVDYFAAGTPRVTLRLDDDSTVPVPIGAAPVAAMPIDPQQASEDSMFRFEIPTGAFSDPDGEPLRYQAALADGRPLPAWLTLDAVSGTFAGLPGNDDVGVYDIMVTASDPGGASAAQQFTLTVANVNDAPVVVRPFDSVAIDEDTPLSVVIAADAFADVDVGDSLRLSLQREEGGPLPAWLQFDAATRRLSGVPANADVGPLRLRVTATDDRGATAQASFVLTVANVNDAPVLASPLADPMSREGERFAYRIADDVFADVDAGDRLTLSASMADGTPLPSWLVFDATSRTLSGTPPLGTAGEILVRVIATDLSGASIADQLRLTIEPGSRVLTGGAGDDLLQGGAGNDVLNGGAGSDRLFAGAGDDTLQFSHDATWGFVNLSNRGSPGISGSGESVVGLLGKRRTLDVIDGGTGQDALMGSIGSDVVQLDTGAAMAALAGIEVLSMGDGDDVVDLTSTRFAYGAVTIDGGNGNDVLWSNAGNDTLLGGAGNDRLTGGAGDDLLDGGIGADALRGGTGNDTYVIDNAGDSVAENASQGEDIVISSITHTLATNFEHLFLTGSSAINGTGNALGNWLRGNAAANRLSGQGGNDTLWGDAGDDQLYGDSGTDLLQGGAGNDLLSDSSGNGLLDGGGGSDTLTGGGGREFYIGGAGSDVINTGGGADILAFNRGDGADVVNASSGSDNTLSLGGGIRYDDLVLNRSGLDLILGFGGGDQITFRNWYQAGVNNRSIVNLQMVAEAMSDFAPGSTDPLRSRKVTQFDFLDIVRAFDAARSSNATLANWNASNALAGQLVASSDASALGGDLAYRYGLAGTLAGVGSADAIALLSTGSFATAPQALQPLAPLSTARVGLA